jgi:NB-ARC domain/TIR domain
VGEQLRGAGFSGDAPVVFVSYNREDAEWRRRFVEMLKPVVREQRLEVWSDERNVLGEQWRPQLAAAIERSRAALLLVSGPFWRRISSCSRSCRRCLSAGRGWCVLVRPCLWDEVAVLERVQWAHDPRGDGPAQIAADPEGQIVRVCKRLLELLPPEEGGERARVPSRDDRGEGGSSAAVIVADTRRGELHDVPPLPARFVARDEFVGLREAVLGGVDGAVGITGKALGLHGQGGIGKTVLAAALARDDFVRRHFPDGVFWVTIGERADLLALQIALLSRLGAGHGELRSASEGLRMLRDALAERRCLLVVDDVWSPAAAQAFAAVGPRGRVLYTTRDEEVLGAVGADVQRVDVLPVATARQLLAGLTGIDIESLPAEIDRVLEVTGRVALALALVGAAVGRGAAAGGRSSMSLSKAPRRFLTILTRTRLRPCRSPSLRSRSRSSARTRALPSTPRTRRFQWLRSRATGHGCGTPPSGRPARSLPPSPHAGCCQWRPTRSRFTICSGSFCCCMPTT